MNQEKRIKLDMAIEKALFKYVNRIKEDVYDYCQLTVRKDPVLSQTITIETMKEIIKVCQNGILQGKSRFIGDFNNEIKKALDEYAGEENPTLSMPLENVASEPMVEQPQQQAKPKIKSKVTFTMPSD
jgi:hypothetical protein